MDDEDGVEGYAWMKKYERSWEAIHEDASGSIKNIVKSIDERNQRNKFLRRRKPHVSTISVMRHLVVIIDISRSMRELDLHPTRLTSLLKCLETFINGFFDQNPISQIGIVTTADSNATVVCGLTSDDNRLKSAINGITEPNGGVPSIQNSLEVGLRMMESVPTTSSRELLVLYGSTSTCDPGHIYDTRERLNKAKICVSVISLCSELFVLKQMAAVTHGKHFVALDEHHLRSCLSHHLYFPRQPGVSKESAVQATLIKMGFPPHSVEDFPSFCVCHPESSSLSGYICPQCFTKHCSIPTECKVCGLLLVIAPHLARSYQRFFPLDAFLEIRDGRPFQCQACSCSVESSIRYVCTVCSGSFCNDCDITAHDNLGFCPLCPKPH